MIDYKTIFEKAEKTLRKESWFSDSEFDELYGQYKKYENVKRTDNEIFSLLIMIVFYSGFRASIVENKENIILDHFPNYQIVSEYNYSDIQHILSDFNMIKNERKINSCISNAKTFKEIIDKHGSFQNYLDSFNADASFENLVLLKEELTMRFVYLGETTVYHFLADLGFKVLKPDRVILRIFKRLGLIKGEEKLLAIKHGQQFAISTGLPIRYIDIVFVKYGQQGESKKFGIKKGICSQIKPNCNVCGLTLHCEFLEGEKNKNHVEN